MAKSKDNIATVQITNNGQVLVTIPRAIASALELSRGSKMEWIIRKDGLLLRWGLDHNDKKK
ncbi:MAG: AbrB/MazE/SpoVT family DNA-binding domain-containing protein [Thermoplasmata archaeon]